MLFWDWTYPKIRLGIKGLTSQAVEGNNTNLKSQNAVTEWTAWGFLWPRLVWRCSVRRFFFSCVVSPSSPKISVWRVNWKFHALHWLFLCYGFLETWKRSRTPGPESKDCKLASESNRTLWNDIFNSRYFSRANSNWNWWQNKGLLENNGIIQVFPRRFRAIFEVSYRSGSRRRHDQETGVLNFCFSQLKSFFKKSCYASSRTGPHPCSKSVVVRLSDSDLLSTLKSLVLSSALEPAYFKVQIWIIRLKIFVFECIQLKRPLCLPFSKVRRWTRSKMASIGWNTGGSI